MSHAAPAFRLGVSFSRHRAERRGLDWQAAFRRVLDLDLEPIRLSVYWDDVERAGPADVDWQLGEAERAGRRVLLSAGMKGQGWPEFFVPDRLRPPGAAGGGGDIVAAGGPALRSATLEFVAATVERYRDRPALEAWQVENEPLNPSGPRRWWIPPELVRDELATVRRLDPGRPVCVNAFAHFNAPVDVASSRFGLLRLTGLGPTAPEAEALSLLGPGDVLGLDVYRRIGRTLLGLRLLSRACGWDTSAGRWLARARAAGRRVWVTEAQAEPWQAWPAGEGPASAEPADLGDTVGRLRRAGFDTVFLWGAEHWLAEEAAGRPEWISAVRALR